MTQLDRFLDRVHRRWSLLRAVERVGVSILISCAVGFVLAIVLITRGEPAMGLIGVCVGIGAVIGVIVGWVTRCRGRGRSAIETRRSARDGVVSSTFSNRNRGFDGRTLGGHDPRDRGGALRDDRE